MEYKIVFGYVPGNTFAKEKVVDEEKTAEAKVKWENREMEKVAIERARKRFYKPKPWKGKPVYTGETRRSAKIPTLDTVVNEAIAEGWVPHGSPYERVDGNMVQAMVKN